MLSNVTPIGYVRHSHNKGIVAIQNMYIYIYIYIYIITFR